jgi:hypothetical protein
MGNYSKNLAKRLRNIHDHKNDAFWECSLTLNFIKIRFEDRYTKEEWRRLQQADGLSRKEADIHYDLNCTMEHWFGTEYWVTLDKKCRYAQHYKTFNGHPLWHLTICRLDKAPARDWQAFQAIKNEIVGPEYEAIEMYPAQSRLMDVTNRYHLWVLAPNEGDETPPRFPFGCRKLGAASKEPQRFIVTEKALTEGRQQFRQLIDRAPVEIRVFPETLRGEAEKEFPDVEFVSAMFRYCEKHPELVETFQLVEPGE